MVTNTDVTVSRIGLGGNDEGIMSGVIDSGAKAAQNDTWTVTGVSSIIRVDATVDATGVSEPVTLSTNVMTLTSATTGACSAIIYYKE